MASLIHYCRWDWCRETFRSHHELDDHVINQHIMKVKPMTLAEIEDFIRADEELGRSAPGALSDSGGQWRFALVFLAEKYPAR